MPDAIRIHPRADPAASVEVAAAVAAVAAFYAIASAPGVYALVLADGHGLTMLAG